MDTISAERIAPWGLTKLGSRELEDAVSVEDAINLADLNHTVRKEPVYYDGERVKGKWFTVDDREKVLGIVGDVYKVIQTTEAFAFINELLGGKDVLIEQALSLRGGSKVVIVARKPENMLIAGEDTARYIAFATSHDGSWQVRAHPLLKRLSCLNMLNFDILPRMTPNAIGRDDDRDVTTRVYNVKHTTHSDLQLAEALRVLDISENYERRMKALGEWLTSARLEVGGFSRFLERLIPLPPEKGRARTVRENKHQELSDVYYTSDNLDDLRGTKWGALQAVVEYNDHVKRYKDADRRMLSVLEGNDFTQRALRILSEN